MLGVAFYGPNAQAQVSPLRDTTITSALDRAGSWRQVGANHVARKELQEIIPRVTGSSQQRALLLTLTRATFDDHEYEEAFARATDLLTKGMSEEEEKTLLYIQGVSAFQTGRSAAAISSLTFFLDRSGTDSLLTRALYWRAMTELETGDWQAAESDLRRSTDPLLPVPRKDIGLMGWALLLERRGDYREAADKLEDFLSLYPGSELRTDAEIRLASISMRLNRPERTVELLRATKPSTEAQQDEFRLLRAEAEFRLRSYPQAQKEYELYLEEFPDSRNSRKARYGLAWSYLRGGEYPSARREFDSLGHGTDSIAFASLYHSGVISLLTVNPNTAFERFDSLVERSTYDRYLDRAYYEMGMIRYRGKFYRDARRYFQLAARLYPESALQADAFHMIGEASMALSDFSNAQYAFAQVRRSGTGGEIFARSMFQEGVALYHLGRFRSSAERFDAFLTSFPKHGDAGDGYIWRGEALYQDGRYAEAERSYAEALSRFSENPRREDAMYGVAWSLFEQKKFSQAAAAFERFTTGFPGSQRAIEASLRKADSYFFMGQYDKSSSLYASLASAKTEGRTIEYAAFQLAMSYVQRGESERGIEHLRKFLTSYPNSIYAEVVQFNIGWTYFSREQYHQAIVELSRVLVNYPESQLLPRVLFNLGDSYFNVKLYDSSRVYYQRVIREYPASPLVADALAGLQYTFEAEGRPREAAAQMDTLLANRPAGVAEEELLLRKGDILFGQGDFAEALQEYQRLLAANPDTSVRVKALYQLGRAFDMENNPARAIEYFQQIVRKYPESEPAPAAALALGLAHFKTKQFSAAVSDYDDLERRYPGSPLLVEAGYHKGVALMGVPNLTAARDQFTLVIRQNQGNIFADRSSLQVARIHLEKKEYKISLDTLNALIDRRNDDLAADALLMIGDNYLAQRKYRDALQSYNDLIQQYADFPARVERARLGLGQTYERMKDRVQARAAYEHILRSPVDPVVKKDVEQRLKKLRR